MLPHGPLEATSPNNSAVLVEEDLTAFVEGAPIGARLEVPNICGLLEAEVSKYGLIVRLRKKIL